MWPFILAFRGSEFLTFHVSPGFILEGVDQCEFQLNKAPSRQSLQTHLLQNKKSLCILVFSAKFLFIWTRIFTEGLRLKKTNNKPLLGGWGEKIVLSIFSQMLPFNWLWMGGKSGNVYVSSLVSDVFLAHPALP